MNELRIISDKSIVFGLNNSEIDSLDRYFFLIVPPILINEILADLTKEADEPSIKNKIANHSYRISGNRGITENYRTVLAHSLMGYEVPMAGKFLPAGERTVRTQGGSIGTRIETTLEDETIARWERKHFTEEEKEWASKWRRSAERSINPKMYTDKIAEAGLKFKPPKDDKELVETVDSLLQERSLQSRLFVLLSREHGIPIESQDKVIKRWFKEGRPMFKDFAPYAFVCLRANFLWALGLTNPQLFQPDKNDRKDLEYCYYLPHCEIFASKDKKHKRLVPFLLRPDQSFVDGEELKRDLRKLSEDWEELSREERIRIKTERGTAPPEEESSKVFQLWKKHRNTISKSLPLDILKMKLVDSSKPKEEQVEITFEEMLRLKMKEFDASNELSNTELDNLKQIHGGADPTTFAVRKTKLSRERILKLHPELEESDHKKSGVD
jgi:hypothetical protein